MSQLNRQAWIEALVSRRMRKENTGPFPLISCSMEGWSEEMVENMYRREVEQLIDESANETGYGRSRIRHI